MNLRPERLRAGLRALPLCLLAVTGIVQGWRAELAGRFFPRASATTLPTGRPPSFYALVADGAAPALALEAARRETTLRPRAYPAWQRRAAAATAVVGTPNREALASLTNAYALAPFAPPSLMVWRVDFAARYWDSLPDALGAASVRQIAALTGIPATFEPRRRWCKTAPPGDLAIAACATVPRVSRDAPLRP